MNNTAINIIYSFEYRNVVLKDSHWKEQFDRTVEYYLAIPNDRLLYPFRNRAGLSSPGQPLAGWYGAGIFCIFGQILGAFAKMYRITGDIRLKEKVLYLVEEWEKCVDKEPSLLKNDAYTYEKLLGGLLDLYEYIGYEKAVKYISKLTDQAIKYFRRDIKRDGVYNEELVYSNMLEWYTLPENLYRAYELIKDAKYKEFAEIWEYDYFWNKLLNKDFKIGARHAYSHVNSLNSAARAYKIKQDKRYLEIIKNGYDEIVYNHTFATGGYGPAESIFVDKEGYLGDSLKSPWDETLDNPMYTNFSGRKVTRSDTFGSFEVSCGSWAVFKLCNYLLKFTGEAKYGDWVEKLLYNGTGALLPLAPDGKIMYYASYFIDGAVKSVDDRRLTHEGYGFTWQCCTGTFPHDVAEYYNMLYYVNENSIYVSQYLPSKVTWNKDDVKIEIENFSQYPEEDYLKFWIKVDKETEFNFKFRIPSWVKREIAVKVNGQDIKIDSKPNEWGIIKRVWRDNDIITIHIPFDLYFKPVDRYNPDIVALLYGPIVLVTDEITELIGDMEKPWEWIHPVKDEKMVFETDKGHIAGYDFLTRTFVPFYKIGPMKWYFMYNRIRK